YARLRYYIANAVQGRSTAAEIRAFNLVPTFEAWSLDAWQAMQRSREKARQSRARLHLLASAVGGLVMTAGAVLSIKSTTTSTLGEMVTIVIGLTQLKLIFGHMFEKLSAVADASLYLRDIEALEAVSHEVAQPHLPIGSNEATHEPVHSITLSRVSYRYPNSVTPAVSAVSLTIRKGELVALVGRNGSGKTTLAKIIAGLLPPSSGSIRWNDHHEYDEVLDKIRDNVTMQFQESTRWCFTVRENIWLGDTRLDETNSRIWSSLQDAGAEDLIHAL